MDFECKNHYSAAMPTVRTLTWDVPLLYKNKLKYWDDFLEDKRNFH